MRDPLRVETEQLRSLARVYDQQADRLQSGIAAFERDGRPPVEAFGVIGAAHDAHASYVATHSQAVGALHQAVHELGNRARDLRAAADLYQLADEASAM